MIRILHYGLSTNTGGIETYLYKIWNNIDKSEFHFDFIDTNLENPCFYDEFTKMGSKFYKITHRNISISKNKRDLHELFENESFDIVHCHLNTLSYIEPVKVALKHGCKVIVHSRSAGAANSLVTNLLHHYHSLILQKNKIKMVAVSKLAGDWLFGKKANFQVINNGIDINKFKFSSTGREKVRKELGIEDKFVVGNIGAFLPAKNHGFMIEIFNELVKKNSKAILLLIGTGSLKEKIIDLVREKNLQDKIMFLGTRTDISNVLSAMDYFLFPSLYEGFPNAVLEAQTSGLQCAISDVITEEVVVSHNCKRISLQLSPAGWADTILRQVDNQDRSVFSAFVKDGGFCVENEIMKVEYLYLNI
ncbi:Putative glycosyltransferase EpsF [Neobacillus rhizosphaerae]|uniref:Glycosyltransferase EpsF n=1 Tax=Neobacillus rhizosphaerae TaxID=2880965 RepID=A0ABN8KWE6_9BACI|nr:glycosyltransferase [Neobacillus rhizosphaerae]CAH2716775.1 Putative glycosyltransferase EpsF [Neobacillus rhizosphaerae]